MYIGEKIFKKLCVFVLITTALLERRIVKLSF